MTGDGRRRAHQPQKKASGFVPGFGLAANSPLRVACPKCEAGVGRQCVKADRYGMESTASGPHPARSAAAREAYVAPINDSTQWKRRQRPETRG